MLCSSVLPLPLVPIPSQSTGPWIPLLELSVDGAILWGCRTRLILLSPQWMGTDRWEQLLLQWSEGKVVFQGWPKPFGPGEPSPVPLLLGCTQLMLSMHIAGFRHPTSHMWGLWGLSLTQDSPVPHNQTPSPTLKPGPSPSQP